MMYASAVHAAIRPPFVRSVDELREDLFAACASLGELAAEWTATGRVPRADLEAVDRTVEGIRRLLVQFRAHGGADG